MELAWHSLQSGARGYIHADMKPTQILRAVTLAERGRLVAPSKLLEYVVEAKVSPYCKLDMLSTRKREVLTLVANGMTNAQIAHKLFISVSTVKQHLYAAYRLLGVKNRTEATRIVLHGD